MNKKIFYSCVIFITASISMTMLIARSWRLSKIPNGKIHTCGACHQSAFGDGPRNSFGIDVERLVSPNGNENFWGPELAAIDSDGDGYTNGEELQDPDGTWMYGDPEPGDQSLVSNPGDPNNTPGMEAVEFPYYTVHKYSLIKNYPNPLKSFTQIFFSLALPGRVNISIFNVDGILETILVDKFFLDGTHRTNYDLEVNSGNKLVPGIYFYRITAGKFSAVKKMVVVK
ncbi:T9SS type A sorting domain-containing protein [Bacteroidota bacterium]